MHRRPGCTLCSPRRSACRRARDPPSRARNLADGLRRLQNAQSGNAAIIDNECGRFSFFVPAHALLRRKDRVAIDALDDHARGHTCPAGEFHSDSETRRAIRPRPYWGRRSLRKTSACHRADRRSRLPASAKPRARCRRAAVRRPPANAFFSARSSDVDWLISTWMGSSVWMVASGLV